MPQYASTPNGIFHRVWELLGFAGDIQSNRYAVMTFEILSPEAPNILEVAAIELPVLTRVINLALFKV